MPKSKVKTLSEAETARRRAVTGLRNLGRHEDADRIEGLSTREYAEEKGFEIMENPRRYRTMARRQPTRAELEETIEQLQEELEEVESERDELEEQIADIEEVLGVEEVEEEPGE